jgi:N-glycosylase/DNA lyase
MKLQHILISASLLASCAVFAQNAPASAPEGANPRMGMARMQKMHEVMTQRHAKHLEELKVSLKLQPEQETHWAAFANSMKPHEARPLKGIQAEMEKLTTPERIDKMMAFKIQRDAEMQKRAEATKTFYATLSDSQKKTFDEHTRKFMHAMEGRHHEHMMHPH